MISLQEAAAELVSRVSSGARRHILGLAGPPGAGKSTAADVLFETATGAGLRPVVVGMDGWHLAHDVLVDRGQDPIKGAPETFDADGFVETIRRIRAQETGDASIWLPQFRREIENAIAGAIEVRADQQLIIVEGNYVLLDESPWDQLGPLFDGAWMLTPSDETRRTRLVARHEQHGRDHADAVDRALGSDERNAQRIRGTSRRVGVLEVDPG